MALLKAVVMITMTATSAMRTVKNGTTRESARPPVPEGLGKCLAARSVVTIALADAHRTQIYFRDKLKRITYYYQPPYHVG